MNPGLFRLFLASLVVLHHSFPVRLGGWAVGAFFVLSGYWIAWIWSRKYSQLDKPYWGFIVSRWWRLAPLFLTIQLLAVSFVLAGYPLGNQAAVFDWRWWMSQPLVAGATQFNILLPPSWSLDVEMQFYIVAPFIVALVGLISRVQFFVVTLLLLTWSVFLFLSGTPLDAPRLDCFAWLFVIGVACYHKRWQPSRTLAVLSAGMLMLVVLAALCSDATRHFVWMHGADSKDLSPTAATAVYIAMLFSGLPLVINSVHNPSGPWDRWFGDLSYPLYLVHWLPRDWYYSHVDWSYPVSRNAFLLAINFASAFIAAVVLLHAIDRPAQRLRDRWLARRQLSRSIGSAPAGVAIDV